jgi:hypothetical protein
LVSFADGRHSVEDSFESFIQQASVLAREQFDRLYPEGVPGDKALHSLHQITTYNLKKGLEKSWAARMPTEGTVLDVIAEFDVGDTTVGRLVTRIEVTAQFGKRYPLCNPRTGQPETKLDISKTTFKVQTTAEHGTWNGGVGRFGAKTTYTGARTRECGLDPEIAFYDAEHDTYPIRQRNTQD